MNIRIESENIVNIDSWEKLGIFLPDDQPNSKVLNFGQGEGQFMINDKGWGAYVEDHSHYVLQFEKGEMGIDEFAETLKRIEKSLEKHLSCKVKLVLEGCHN